MPKFQNIINVIEKNAFYKLGEIVDFSNEVTDFTEFDNGVFNYLEISGISLVKNSYQTTIVDVKEAPSRARMKTQINDLVVSLTRPHRGAITVILEDKIIASTGFAVIRNIVKTVDRKWLLYVLLSDFSLQQMLQRSSGGNYPAITENELKKILIPDIDYAKQKQLCLFMDQAEKKYNKKLQQADELLKQFENIITTEFHLTSLREKKLCTAIKLKQLDGVIDAKRYMMKSNNSTLVLSDVCNIVEKKENVSSYDKQTVDWIRIDDLSNNPTDIEMVRTQPANEMDGSFFVVHEGDILVARLGPTILNQKIVMVRQTGRITLASAEFLVLRCKNGYNAEMVMAVLKTEYYKKLMYSHARGSTPSRYRLNREDALNLPFPDIIMLQEKIAKQAVDVRNKVKVLRQEAGTEWAEAKVQFERELLGE